MTETIRKIITKSDITRILQEFLKNYDVLAPVDIGHGVLIMKITNPDQVAYEYTNALNVPKELLIPPHEVLFRYTRENKIEKPDINVKPFIVWGIRPCDAKSFELLDDVFTRDYIDPYYEARRDNSVLIGMGCLSPVATCLCTSFDEKGPQSTEAMDALVTPLDDKTFFLEIITEKGKKLLEKYGSHPTDQQIKRKKTVHEEAIKKIVRELKVPDNMRELFNDEYWDKASAKCISCGICRFLCPTCHCFSLVDEEKKKIKYCDACSFPAFTKEASGHNPRGKKAARYKQWYYHKFEYSKLKNGKVLCVGCGRCTIHCPVKIDFTKVLNEAPKKK